MNSLPISSQFCPSFPTIDIPFLQNFPNSKIFLCIPKSNKSSLFQHLLLGFVMAAMLYFVFFFHVKPMPLEHDSRTQKPMHCLFYSLSNARVGRQNCQKLGIQSCILSKTTLHDPLEHMTSINIGTYIYTYIFNC